MLVRNDNQIVNNTFYYNRYDGAEPAIWLGARNGRKKYCDLESGFGFGSSASNLDYARYNVIAENQIYRLSVSKMIRVGTSLPYRPSWIYYAQGSTPNYFFNNQTVSRRIYRQAGCYVEHNGSNIFVKDGDYAGIWPPNVDETRGYKYWCDDNVFVSLTTGGMSKRNFACSVTGSNSGCAKTFSCPVGRKLVSMKAGCNLEWGDVTSSQLNSIPWGSLDVTRTSSSVSAGTCSVGDTTIHSGETSIDEPFGMNRSVEVSCKEHDKNGGDCVIRGQALCL